MDIKSRLKEWGRWSNADDSGVGFKPIWEAIERHAPVQDTGVELRKASKPLIHDDEAIEIDRAVSSLNRENPVMAKIIKKTYVRKNTVQEIARYYLTPLEYPEQASMDWDHAEKRKVDVRIARLMLKTAESMVEIELMRIYGEKGNR